MASMGGTVWISMPRRWCTDPAPSVSDDRPPGQCAPRLLDDVAVLVHGTPPTLLTPLDATGGRGRQGRVDNAFFRYKSIIGDGLHARSPAGQGSEAVLGCEILNRMTALGRPASYRIGR